MKSLPLLQANEQPGAKSPPTPPALRELHWVTPPDTEQPALRSCPRVGQLHSSLTCISL